MSVRDRRPRPAALSRPDRFGHERLMESSCLSDATSGYGEALAGMLASIAAGDHAALAELYRRTSAKLYGICLRMLHDEEEAQEALQEAYLTIWRRAASFDA